VRREPPPNAGVYRGSAQLHADRGCRPRSSLRRSVDDAEQRADRHLLAELQPRLELLPAPGIHADLSPLPALAAANENRATVRVEIALGQGERLADPQSSAPQDDEQAAQTRTASPISPADRITRTISSTDGGSAG
jgi:hypothetical protein